MSLFKCLQKLQWLTHLLQDSLVPRLSLPHTLFTLYDLSTVEGEPGDEATAELGDRENIKDQ